ncbi:sensor histidine kinase [Glutamicibacter sp.]|uniref:sensor histidine kinase n=1 Tax=Glutamicibacter sp. TaxID=1931995 RepID=UPI003D6AC648
MSRPKRWPRASMALLVALCNVAAFSVLVAEQATEWATSWPVASLLWWVGGTTLVIGLLLVAVSFYLCTLTSSWLVRVLSMLGLCALQAWVRAQLLLPATFTDQGSIGQAAIFFTGFFGYSFALGTGLAVSALLEREDAERVRRIDGEQQLRQSVQDLEQEEMRVRQVVADRLHGTVQQRLVAIASGLEVAAAEFAGQEKPRWSDQLRTWSAELDELRENQVRSLSHTLFPSGADLGTYDALRMLLDRLPITIHGSIKLGPRLQDAVHRHRALLPLVDRLVVIYAVEEAVTNAIKHGAAQGIAIQAEIHPADHPGPDGRNWIMEVDIDDDGSGPGAGQPVFSGLIRHEQRLQVRGGVMRLERSPGGGGRLHLSMPFQPTVPLAATAAAG